MREVKFFTKAELIRANGEAIRSNRNRTLYAHLLDLLPDIRFPVAMNLPHGPDEVRVGVVMPSPGTDEPIPGIEADGRVTAFLDVPRDTFESLGVAVVRNGGGEDVKS